MTRTPTPIRDSAYIVERRKLKRLIGKIHKRFGRERRLINEALHLVKQLKQRG